MTLHPLRCDGHWYLQKLRRLVRERGLWPATRELVKAGVARVFRSETDIVISKKLAAGQGWTGPVRLEVRALGGTEDPAFRGLVENSEFGRSQRRALISCAENGYSAFLALVDGEAIGIMWWVDNRSSLERAHPHLNRFGIHLEDRQAYLFGFFIRREFRGGGRSNEFLAKIEAELARVGYERLFGIADIHNNQARWLYRLTGWEDLRTCRCRTLLSFVMLADRRLFVRNGERSSPHRFDFRQVFPSVRTS